MGFDRVDLDGRFDFLEGRLRCFEARLLLDFCAARLVLLLEGVEALEFEVADVAEILF